MEDNVIGTPLKETLEEFKSYLENQISYNKLMLTKRMGEFSSYIMLMLTLLGICGFILFFLLFAFASWFGKVTGLGSDAGYLLVAGIYALIGLLIFIYREKLIFGPIRRFFGRIFFGDTHPENDPEIFKTEENLKRDIKRAQKELLEQREQLSLKINELANTFTITNIAHQVVGSAYNQVVSTANIAKYAFKVIQAIKKFSSKKKKSKKIDRKDHKKLNISEKKG